MRVRNFLQTFLRPIAKLAGATVLVLCVGTLAVAQKEATIHNFTGGTDGSEPEAALISDGAGNLYGTTVEGGNSANCGEANNQAIGCGTVYQLAPPGDGVDHWTETILYAFQGGTTDGSSPEAPLIFDAAGNLYGTTVSGPSGGTIFELSPPTQSGGAWTETVLYIFPRNISPGSGLARDSEGNLFGETLSLYVYELSPPTTQGGSWTYTALQYFDKVNVGTYPTGGLVLDEHGNLYGASTLGGTGSGSTCPGGAGDCGLVFELLRPASCTTWKEKVLYNFTGENEDGGQPKGGVILHNGDIYGTTAYGGTANGGGNYGDGTVFKLSPGSNGGPWTESTLYAFNHTTGAYRPVAGVVFDKKGNLYSDTYFGKNIVEGEVFELSPPAKQGDAWAYTDLFDSNCGSDGCYMLYSLIVGKGNVLYGVSTYGGTDPNDGLVFGITP
jgi:hypothetical protein